MEPSGGNRWQSAANSAGTGAASVALEADDDQRASPWGPPLDDVANPGRRGVTVSGCRSISDQ